MVEFICQLDIISICFLYSEHQGSAREISTLSFKHQNNNTNDILKFFTAMLSLKCIYYCFEMFHETV